MQITRTIEERIELGDDDDARITVELTHVEGSELTNVRFRLGEDSKQYAFDSEVIERIASAIRLRRKASRDYEPREVCPDHGSYIPDYRSEAKGDCLACEMKRRAKDAQLRLANMGNTQP